MNILFVHQNCPGQFLNLAAALANGRGNDVRFMTRPGRVAPDGVKLVTYPAVAKHHARTHRLAQSYERAVRYGQAAARAAARLKRSGYKPDLIYAHPGWGEALFLKDVYPDVHYCEFYFGPGYGEWYFERPPNLPEIFQLRANLARPLVDLLSADWGVSPTQWQKSQYPEAFRDKISVAHEGVNVMQLKRLPRPRFKLPNGKELMRRDKVITYASRNLEPARGFPTFLKAVELLCARRNDCQFVIAGGDEVSYSLPLPAGQTYREKYSKQFALDSDRVHFTGRVPFNDYINLLNISAAHVYLTIPFVLSRSMMQAMACECLIVGSATPPVEEVLVAGENGLLVDLQSPEALCDTLDEALSHPRQFGPLRKNARQTIVDRYRMVDCLKQQFTILEAVANRQIPPV